MVEGAGLGKAFYVLAAACAGAGVAAAAGFYPLAYVFCLMGGLGAGFAARRSRRAWVAFAGAYIIAPGVALLWLRGEVENGRALTILLFLIVWSADTGAYFFGRFVGGPRLSPVLSPAKTWAGAAGGVLFGGVAGFFGAGAIYGPGAEGFYALIGAGLGLASILGDMTESAFKRIFGVKDISGFIPGHGGVLDRLDGMIFATVAVTAVLYGYILFSGL